MKFKRHSVDEWVSECRQYHIKRTGGPVTWRYTASTYVLGKVGTPIHSDAISLYTAIVECQNYSRKRKNKK